VRWFTRLLMLGALAGLCAMPVQAGGKSGDYGTSLKFEKTPKDAATRAAKEEKLVFVVHVSGIFENTDFT
jgi:hypothetical protein